MGISVVAALVTVLTSRLYFNMEWHYFTFILLQLISSPGVTAECVTCGNYEGNYPCTIAEIMIGPSESCPLDKPYCMNDIVQQGSDVSYYKRCVNEEVCKALWLQGTSGNANCMNYDPGTAQDIICHFCCSGDECNYDDVPAKDTLYSVH